MTRIATAAPAAAPAPVTTHAPTSEDETQRALGYLATAGYAVSEAVKDLRPAQWTWRPGTDRWSIAEIVEHLALLEELFVVRLAPRLREGPSAAETPDPDAADQRLIALATDRSIKSVTPGRAPLNQAPALLLPKGAWSPEASLARFREQREAAGEFLRTAPPGLRGRSVDHPALGPLDGHQWVLFLAAHSVRHTKQILEVKAEPGFPA